MPDTECLPQFDGGCDLHKENAQLKAAIRELTLQLASAERHAQELNRRLAEAGVNRVPDCADAWAQQDRRVKEEL